MDGTATGDVALASERLPERQREALSLHEFDGLSYEEVAKRMAASPSSVALLIAHARINLYDELRGTVLASVAPSADCERALPLIAAREDGELGPGSPDAEWLEAHVANCDRCRRGVEEMGDAQAAYAAWTSADAPRSADARPAGPRLGKRHRRGILIACLAALLLVAGVAATLVGGDPSTTSVDQTGTARGAGGSTSQPGATPGPGGKTKDNDAKGKKRKQTRKADSAPAVVTEPSTEVPSTAVPVPVEATGGDGSAEPVSRPDRPQGKTAVEPTQRTSATKTTAKPNPAPASTASPTPAAAPPATTTESPPPEESTGGPPRRRDPPGKPAGRPPR